jgi:uncharacterized protein YbbK (DUF523 family)
LGGLSTPRLPSNIVGGDGSDVLSGIARVIDSSGLDVTDCFKLGAKESLRLAGITGARTAILKDKSPSCGLATPYCEKPGGTGMGVTAALFSNSGINIFEMGKGDIFPDSETLIR